MPDPNRFRRGPVAPGMVHGVRLRDVMAFVHNPDRGAAGLILLAAQDFT